MTTPTTRFEAARLEIAREHLGPDALPRALARAVRISAQTLEVARVGVWFFSPDRATLRADPMHDRALDRCVSVAPLDMTRYPAYLEALGSRRMVRAGDALTDPRTAELAADYLRPAGIGALLDAPVFRAGEVVGVVCHEHVGGPRVWTERDADFATSVADMVGALLEQAQRIEAEVEAARASRLAALGRLAAACAHDMGNVLSAISLTAQGLQLPSPPQTPAEAAAQIVEACARGGALVQHLLAFARNEPRGRELVDLAALVREAGVLLEPLLRGHATLELRLAPGEQRVLADRSELMQVVINLLVNARDAGARTVVVTAGPATAGGSDLELSVRDDGAGMDAGVRERAFEPFFTTKPDGTGMGLAIVHGAVSRAGGTVRLESAPGAGTSIFVRLPRA